MADQNDQSVQDSGASAEAPAANGGTTDLETIMAAIRGELDTRFGGITTLIDKKVSPLAQELQQLKTASLSPEELEQQQEQAGQAELENLRRENAMLKLKERFPNGVSFFDEVMSQESLEDQLALIEKRFGKGAAEKVAEAAEAAGADPSTPAVDPNNPARESKPGLAAAFAGAEMTEEMADQILAAAGDTPLALQRRRISKRG